MRPGNVTHGSAAAVESAFYEALAHADLEAMMRLWAEEEEVACIHPDGRRRVGLAAVRESWQQLFASGARLVIRTEHEIVSASGVLVVHNVVEHVTLAGDEQRQATLVATNAYVRGPRGWRMVLHHASPAAEVSASPLERAPRTVH